MKKREMGYLEWMEDAERRTKAGQKQYQCACHKTWHWWDQRKGHTLLGTPKTVKKWTRWRFVGKTKDLDGNTLADGTGSAFNNLP